MINTILKVFRIFSIKEKIGLAALFGAMTVTAILEMIGISLVVPIISLMINPNGAQASVLTTYIIQITNMDNSQNLFSVLCIAMATVYFTKNLALLYLYKYQYAIINQLQVNAVVKLFNKYIRKPYEYHLDANFSDMVRNVTTETNNLFLNLVVAIINLISEILIVGAIFILLIIAEPYITLGLCVVLLAVTYSVQIIIGKRLKKEGFRRQEHVGSMIKWVNQGIGAIKEVKLANNEGFFIEKLRFSATEFAESNKKYQVLDQVPRLSIEFIIVVCVTVILLVKNATNGSPFEYIPSMSLFGMAAFKLLPSVNRINGYFNKISYYKSSVDVLAIELINQDTESSINCSVSQMKDLKFSLIRINGLSYSYPNTDRVVLQDVELVINRGTSNAFIGPSGSGKTTFVDIVLGILKPTSGEILIDDTPLESLGSEWGRYVAYVPQNVYLFDDTLLENVLFGSEYNEKRFFRAIKDARLMEFLEGTKDKEFTRIGERGIKLSGGQRQRLGIARALYKNPEILILDEATSALDTDTEQEIVDAVENLHGKVTTVVVAHRLSTVLKCDNIYKVVNSRIVSVEKKELMSGNYENNK